MNIIKKPIGQISMLLAATILLPSCGTLSLLADIATEYSNTYSGYGSSANSYDTSSMFNDPYLGLQSQDERVSVPTLDFGSNSQTTGSSSQKMKLATKPQGSVKQSDTGFNFDRQ